MTPTRELAERALRLWAQKSGHDLIDLQSVGLEGEKWDRLLVDPFPYIEEAINLAVKEVNENCAKIADGYLKTGHARECDGPMLATMIAADIRRGP